MYKKLAYFKTKNINRSYTLVIHMATEVEVRKWGNSMGIILPRELITAQELKQHDRILIDVVKRADLTDVCGSFKTKKSGQEFKNMVRKGWQR